jgi:hypothetical protein
MKRIATAAVLLAIAGGCTSTTPTDGASQPTQPTASEATSFAIDSFHETLSPGSTLSVSGHGCPPTSEFTTGEAPLVLVLTPPSGGNNFGPALLGGRVTVVMNDMYVPGESQTTSTPDRDGTFSATIQIPTDAPVGGPYTVRGVCATLVRSGQEVDGMDPASVTAAQASAGVLSVET